MWKNNKWINNVTLPLHFHLSMFTLKKITLNVSLSLLHYFLWGMYATGSNSLINHKINLPEKSFISSVLFGPNFVDRKLYVLINAISLISLFCFIYTLKTLWHTYFVYHCTIAYCLGTALSLNKIFHMLWKHIVFDC